MTQTAQAPEIETSTSESSPQPSRPRLRDNEIGVILGRKGLGKTTLTRHLLRQCGRCLVLDTNGRDYGGGCVVTSRLALIEYWAKVSHYEEFSIIVRPRDDETAQMAFQLARSSENLWLIVEEADRYCNASKIDPDFQWLINYSRQQNVSIIAVARRAARLHRDLTANADWIVAHQTTEPRDLEYLSEYMSVDDLPHLEKFQWSKWGTSRLTFS